MVAVSALHAARPPMRLPRLRCAKQLRHPHVPDIELGTSALSEEAGPVLRPWLPLSALTGQACKLSHRRRLIRKCQHMQKLQNNLIKLSKCGHSRQKDTISVDQSMLVHKYMCFTVAEPATLRCKSGALGIQSLLQSQSRCVEQQILLVQARAEQSHRPRVLPSQNAMNSFVRYVTEL